MNYSVGRFRTNLWNHYVKSYTTKDWCISRQLWWGQRIPAFKCSVGDESKWFAAQCQEEAVQQAVTHFSTLGKQQLEADDVRIQQGVTWVRFVWVGKHANKNKFFSFAPNLSQKHNARQWRVWHLVHLDATAAGRVRLAVRFNQSNGGEHNLSHKPARDRLRYHVLLGVQNGRHVSYAERQASI